MLRWLCGQSDAPQNTRRHVEAVLKRPDDPRMVTMEGTPRGHTYTLVGDRWRLKLDYMRRFERKGRIA